MGIPKIVQIKKKIEVYSAMNYLLISKRFIEF